MDTRKRFEDLIGKKGVLKIKYNGEVEFTYLSVELPSDLPADTDHLGFNELVSRCTFRVRFDEGVCLDGQNTMDIPGAYISRIEL